MNKSELVAAVQEATQLKKKDAEAAVVAFVDTVKEALKKGEKVQLIGFGTFKALKRAARKGKNPRTGEALKIAATTVPKFTPGAGFKAAVAKKK